MRKLQPQGSEQNERGWTHNDAKKINAPNPNSDHERPHEHTKIQGATDTPKETQQGSHGEWMRTQLGNGHSNDHFSYIQSRIGAFLARQDRHDWTTISDFLGVVHGDAEGLDIAEFSLVRSRIKNRAHRIHALGNLNPPIIPEMIGRAILEAW
jgi:hypothetical protein